MFTQIGEEKRIGLHLICQIKLSFSKQPNLCKHKKKNISSGYMSTFLIGSLFFLLDESIQNHILRSFDSWCFFWRKWMSKDVEIMKFSTLKPKLIKNFRRIKSS